MRSIKKKINVKVIEATVYDRAAKEEKTITLEVPEIVKVPQMPENCVLIDQIEISSKEVEYTMTAEDFVKYATKK